VELTDIGLRHPTLDDVFLALTGHHAEEAQANGNGAAAGATGRRGRRNGR
jgi:ABC-2 type transport system ATP-binding protein